MNISSTEEEDEEESSINEEELRELIVQHGGVVLKKFHGRDIQRLMSYTQTRETRNRRLGDSGDQSKQIICITERPCTTYKVF